MNDWVKINLMALYKTCTQRNLTLIQQQIVDNRSLSQQHNSADMDKKVKAKNSHNASEKVGKQKTTQGKKHKGNREDPAYLARSLWVDPARDKPLPGLPNRSKSAKGRKSRQDLAVGKTSRDKMLFRLKQAEHQTSTSLRKGKILTTSPIGHKDSKSNSRDKSQHKESKSRMETARSHCERINRGEDNPTRRESQRQTAKDGSPLKEKSRSKSKAYRKQKKCKLPGKENNLTSEQLLVIKPKKKVTEIKTQFSERRGSYFDDELLKRLDQNRVDKCEQKNSFAPVSEQLGGKKQQLPMLLRQRDIEYLKNEQAMKWRIILLELIKLRHEGKMPDQIDRIITQLDVNYTALHEQGIEVLKDASRISDHVVFSVAGSEEPDVAVKTEEAQVENESPGLPVIEGKVDNPGSIFQVYMDCSPRFQNSVSLEKQDQIQLNDSKRARHIHIDDDFFVSSCPIKESFLKTGKQSMSFTAPNQLPLDGGAIITMLQTQSEKNLLDELMCNVRHNPAQLQGLKCRQFQEELESACRQENQKHSFCKEVQVEDHGEEIENYSPRLASLIALIEDQLVGEYCQQIIRSKEILSSFVGQVERALGDFSNCFVLKTTSKFLSYLQTHHQDYFLHEIRKAYELKPLYVLKLVRCFADDLEHDSEDDAGDFVQDIINYEMIAAFERNSFCSQEYLIDDFSFRRAIYDSLNEIFDELRPYGVNGKSIFSLKLSTGITTMEQAQSKSLARLSTILHGKEEQIEWYEHFEDGLFENKYFLALDIINEILDDEAGLLSELIGQSRLAAP